MPKRSEPDPHQPALDCAREILDGRRPTDEGARRMTDEVLPALSDDPEARRFAGSFAEALRELQALSSNRSGFDDRVRHVAWQVVAAWREPG
jgi:hypothetical protein